METPTRETDVDAKFSPAHMHMYVQTIWGRFVVEFQGGIEH